MLEEEIIDVEDHTWRKPMQVFRTDEEVFRDEIRHGGDGKRNCKIAKRVLLVGGGEHTNMFGSNRKKQRSVQTDDAGGGN